MSINLPEDTRIHKRLPKETFYKRLELTSALQEKFVSDIDKIFVENSLTSENLNLYSRRKRSSTVVKRIRALLNSRTGSDAEDFSRHGYNTEVGNQ